MGISSQPNTTVVKKPQNCGKKQQNKIILKYYLDNPIILLEIIDNIIGL
jgi:hypothetical protein